jgi:uncharacterized protein (TIGR04255 family)
MALYHLPVAELKAQQIGLYWSTIRDRFPLCDQQPPIGIPPDVPGEFLPLPRFWFHRDAESALVQIQRNAFIFNWRRGSNNEYPHYESVKKEFWDELSHYRLFLQDSLNVKLDIANRCELTYINLVSPSNLWDSPSAVGKIFPALAGFNSLESETRELVGFNSALGFKVSDALSVDLSWKLGKRADTQELIVVLELKAHGTPEGMSVENVSRWFDSAHDATYAAFLACADRKIRAQWDPV